MVCFSKIFSTRLKMRVFILLTFVLGITTVCVDAGKRRSSDTEKPRGDSGSDKDNCGCSSEVGVGRVCASDGDTYDSPCHFRCESKSSNARIISYEACRRKNGKYKRSKLEKARSKSKKGQSKKSESRKNESIKSDEVKTEAHSSSESKEKEVRIVGSNVGTLRDTGVAKIVRGIAP